VYRCAPDAALTPREVLAVSTLGPLPIALPSTIAAACTNAGVWSMEQPSFALDEFDWWIQISPTFVTESTLRAEGLATLSELWWDNERIATSSSMFVPLSVVVPEIHGHASERGDEASMWLCFRSVSNHLRLTANRRDRPAWKSRLVDHQGLRRVRTSLLGRMPGWSPPVPAVGPYRPLHLSNRSDLHDPANLVDVSMISTITTDGTPVFDLTGPISAPLRVPPVGFFSNRQAGLGTLPSGSIAFSVQAPAGVVSAVLRIHRPSCSPSDSADTSIQAEVLAEFDGVCEHSANGISVTISASGTLNNVALWWPHTHGDPWLYPVSIVLKDSTGDEASHQVESVGFRSVTVDRALDGFGIVINGEPVYARGACWTPVDLISLNPSDDLLDDTLDTVVAAGMNMIRVGGTMTYETDRFHQRCDSLGIMVWQDFMFANLEIPLDSDTLLNDIRAEVSHHAQRVGRHASTVVVCGGSEVDQQAAMMGVPVEQWSSGLARSVIEPLCAQIIPHVPFVISSPSAPPARPHLRSASSPARASFPTGKPDRGLPFQVDSGIGHYYGVGAYLRGFDDVRRSNVRFAAECLAFANVPENSTLDALFGDGGRAPHQPLWKQRVPRDNGAGWDFDDVRDHYLAELFDLDPMRLRYADLERWLDLSRVTSSEVLDVVASEWRRTNATCNGSLVWFLRDLWTGAGWGLIDALGRPKPAIAGLARRWQSVALALTDEGVNGLDAHVVNETAASVTGNLEAVIVRDGVTIVEQAQRSITLAPRSTQRIRVDELFGGFRDLTWAYRFGPPVGELVRVRFRSEAQPGSVSVVRDAHHWVAGRPTAIDASIGLTVSGEPIRGSDSFRLTIGTERTAFGIHLDGDELRSSDNWFHLAPGDQRVLTVRRPRVSNSLEPVIGESFPKIVVRALNSRSSSRVTW
jgi:beta-mannosidase